MTGFIDLPFVEWQAREAACASCHLLFISVGTGRGATCPDCAD